MDPDQQEGGDTPPERPGECVIEFGPDADDALFASLRVFANLGIVVSIAKVDGSSIDVVPVVVDEGQMLCSEWNWEGGRSEETVVVRIEEVMNLRVV